MTKTGLKIIPFSSSDEDYETLYQLEKSIDYHIKEFGSVELLKYHGSLIPKKCKPITNFLELDNKIFGYGYTGHDSWAFDETLLDSNLSFPCEEKYLASAQEYLEYQIDHARNSSGVEIFRAWLFQGNDFMTDFYTKNGFEISQVEFVSKIDLKDFDESKFQDSFKKFNSNGFEIKTLKELQESNEDWESKLYDLWHGVEVDVPTDVVEPQKNIEEWRAHQLTPWFKPEDFYIALDGNKWVALSTYSRGDIESEVISTELTGVLPEYRRKSICTALKVFALSDIKKKGFKRIFTGNEENNPMFQINLMLGFKKIATEIGCKLKL